MPWPWGDNPFTQWWNNVQSMTSFHEHVKLPLHKKIVLFLYNLNDKNAWLLKEIVIKPLELQRKRVSTKVGRIHSRFSYQCHSSCPSHLHFSKYKTISIAKTCEEMRFKRKQQELILPHRFRRPLTAFAMQPSFWYLP